MTLKEAIANKGMTFRHVSIAAGITERELHRIATGAGFPSLPTANRLVTALDATLEFHRVKDDAIEIQTCFKQPA